MARDTEMQDADAVGEEQMMYGRGASTAEELNEKWMQRSRGTERVY